MVRKEGRLGSRGTVSRSECYSSPVNPSCTGMDEVIQSQDLKLQEIKKSVFSSVGGPIRLSARQPILMASITDVPAPSLMISTHYNDHDQSLIGGGATEPTKVIAEMDVDFSRAEDFLQLETPIDARKDHNMLKLASTIPSRTFMSRILHRYPINKKRLAFIQRKPTSSKSQDVMGTMLASGRGGEGKEISISCQVCGQRFNRQHQFQRHILTHVDPEHKKFLCQICGKRFNRADHLNRHAILHGDIKVHKCLLCGEEFERASHLDRHRRKLHPPAGQPPSQTPPLTPQMSSPLEIPSPSPSTPLDSQGGSGNNLHLLAAVATPDGCSNGTGLDILSDSDLQIIQEQGFTSLNPEDTSEREKEPDRPYACEVCGRKFIRATHLRRHTRIHTGEKPFACHICGRRYARGDYLRAHIHAHRRDKIHKCKHCGEVFQDLTRFAEHCRVVHKDLDDEFGNPKPPPDNSPPPPPHSCVEDSLALESAEEIMIYSSMASSIHDNVVTLVNVPEPVNDGEVIIRSVSSHLTPLQTPLTSPDLHLHTLTTHPDSHLMHNGQIPMSSIHIPVPDTMNEITISSQPKTMGTYVDPIMQYVLPNGNNCNNVVFPTPRPSPILGQQPRGT